MSIKRNNDFYTVLVFKKAEMKHSSFTRFSARTSHPIKDTTLIEKKFNRNMSLNSTKIFACV